MILIGRGIRIGLFWALSIILLVIVLSFLAKGQNEHQYEVAERQEHRMTAMETRLDAIQADIRDLRQTAQYNWFMYLTLAGLAGEAGLRIIKRKQSPEE